MTHCTHGHERTRCQRCTHFGIADVSRQRRNECHREHHIPGQRCQHPRQQSVAGCAGCAEFSE